MVAAICVRWLAAILNFKTFVEQQAIVTCHLIHTRTYTQYCKYMTDRSLTVEFPNFGSLQCFAVTFRKWSQKGSMSWNVHCKHAILFWRHMGDLYFCFWVYDTNNNGKLNYFVIGLSHSWKCVLIFSLRFYRMPNPLCNYTLSCFDKSIVIHFIYCIQCNNVLCKYR